MKLEQLKIGTKVIGGIMRSEKREPRTVVAIQPKGYVDWKEGCKVKNKNGSETWEYYKYLKPFNNSIKKI